MRIFLIGFMGCGKTTLGGKLASKLNYSFIDLDKMIEEQTGLTIAAYFEKFGEEAFREKERQTLQDAEFPANVVIATGGGAPCFFDNIDWMNRNGITVYLSMSPKALAHRLKGGKDERPLIRDKSEQELEQFISAKLAERETFYQQAGLVLPAANLNAKQLAEALEPYLK